MHPTDPVNRLMTTAVLTVDINDPAGEVLRIFAEHPIHHLPVLDQQRVAGMLSSADVMKLNLFLPKGGTSSIEYLNARMKVGMLVGRTVLTIQPQQSVEIATQLMAKHGVHSLAVVDPDDHLLGIITTTDIIHAALGAEVAPRQSTATSAGAHSQGFRLNAEQLSHALATAAMHAGTERDPDFVHRALVHLNARAALLDQIRHIAGRFVHAGQDQRLHATLLRALEAANRETAPE